MSFSLIVVLSFVLAPSVLAVAAPKATETAATTASSADESTTQDDSVLTASSNAVETTAAQEYTFSSKIKDFRFSKMVSDVKSALKNLNFISWHTYYVQGRAEDENGAEHTDKGWDAIAAELRGSGASFGEYCAQYSATMTNWVYTMAAVAALLILYIKGIKKWYWYMFFVILFLTSVSSVGMHTADYGEFARYTMTTKLLASFVDMTFTELTVWGGVICFTFEFYENRPQAKKKITTIATVWTAIVLLVLTFEVFVINNRFLWIGGRGPDGLPYDMGGDHGGLSLAEFGCFITGLPLIYVLAANYFKTEKRERRLLAMLLSIFAISFVITIPWGDNEINSFALGNFQGHSIWHMMNAVGTLIAAFWADSRTTAQEKEKEIEAIKAKNRELEAKLATITVS